MITEQERKSRSELIKNHETDIRTIIGDEMYEDLLDIILSILVAALEKRNTKNM